MEPTFIVVVGGYPYEFVGPFPTSEEAQAWADSSPVRAVLIELKNPNASVAQR